MKRHISPLSRHLSDAYKDVRRLKITLKTLEITCAEACCPPYTDAIDEWDALFREAKENAKVQQEYHVQKSKAAFSAGNKENAATFLFDSKINRLLHVVPCTSGVSLPSRRFPGTRRRS